MATRQITASFLPLIDASILIAAREKGFAEEEGLELVLSRETSWANVRDRMAIGHFDVAHMLAPMPIAANLGLNPFSAETIAPMALGLGGNAITVSVALFEELGATARLNDAAAAGQALLDLISERALEGREKLRIGVVHPHSAHNLELRYWLAASSIDPESDVEIVVLPPSLMPDALARGQVDGFCVGEPWNTIAEQSGHGKILTTKNAIWASSPEKVLGVTARFAQEREGDLHGLLRALYKSAQWCADAAHREVLAHILADTRYLNLPAQTVANALGGVGGFEPFAKAATFPWRSHALWFYSQMVRWGQVKHAAGNGDIALKTYRPDIYRDALEPLDVPMPAASSKVEGAMAQETPVGVSKGTLVLGPDGFFDGHIFDPEKLDAYIASQRAQFSD